MADIQLSTQLFEDIQAAVRRQEPEADQGMVLQYLAAIIGYLLGSQRGIPPAERDAVMDELCAFARHVYQDLAQRQAGNPPAAPGGAFGYWQPPKT